MPTEINVYIGSAEQGEIIKKRLEGLTFLRLYVNVCPYQGQWHVKVGTLRPETTEKELSDMALQVLCDDLTSSATRGQ